MRRFVRRRWLPAAAALVVLALVALVLVLGRSATAPPVALPSSVPGPGQAPVGAALPPPVGCTLSTASSGPGSGVAPSGSFRECLQLPDLAPGRYALRLEGSFVPPSASSGPTGAGSLGGADLALAPASGPPGGAVSFSGTYAGGPPVDSTTGTVDVCWSGCATGLLIPSSVTWSGPHFAGVFEVPTEPWIGPAGVVVPADGAVTVGLECFSMDVAPACFGNGAAAVSFRVTGAVGSLCATVSSCAALSVTPTAAAPGADIEVSGWIPVPSAPIAAGNFVLAWATETATPSLARDVATPPAPFTLLLATAGLTVGAAPAWAGVGGSAPVLIQPNALGNLQSDPASAMDLAECSASGVEVSRTGGASWRLLPTSGAPWLAFGGRCDAAWIDGTHPQSAWVVSRITINFGQGVPAYLGSETTDGGATWKGIPIPDGVSGREFGGFLVDGGTVAALYVEPGVPAPGAPVAVVATSDGGATWQPANLPCPSVGPCVRWGPAMVVNCAAGGAQGGQGVLFSPDRTHWEEASNPATVSSPCAPAYLETLGSGQVLWLSGGPRVAFPSLMSADGGKTWQAFAVPPLPASLGGPAEEDLLDLPSGSLLAFGVTATAVPLLPARATAWCAAAGSPLPLAARYEAFGSKLWWASAAGGLPGSLPVSSLVC